MRKALNLITTLIVFLLAFLMVILWINYITLQFNDNLRDEKITLDKNYWIFTDSASSSSDVVADEYYFSPLSVSLILSSEGYTSAYNEALTKTLYESHKHLLREVFSSSYICASSDGESWDNALKVSNGVLIEYPTALPYTFISLFNGKTDSFATGNACSIKSILLYNDESNALTALAKDGKGNIYSFTLQKDSDSPSLVYDFNSNNLAAYTVNKGFTHFVFNNSAPPSQKNEQFEPEYKILSSSPNLTAIKSDATMKSTWDIAFSDEQKNYFELINEKTLSTVLDAFEVNPNIVGYYSDPLFGLYFVGDKMTLSISPSGVIEYVATDENPTSLLLSSFLNSDRTSFNSNEFLTAATAFLKRFPLSLIGGEATPVLSNVFYSQKEKEFTFEFVYHYNLCEVLKNNKKSKITLTFSDKALIHAEIQTLNVSDAGSLTENEGDYLDMSMTPIVVSKMLIYDGEFSPVYNFTKDGQTVIPLWMEKVEGGADK